jgi:enamine deaminase RidA (YjgF/YER057c/UK114 family)
VSGQLPLFAGKLTMRGKLGAGLSEAQGADLARRCTINALGAVRGHLGTLNRVTRVVKVTGFVASAPGFGNQPQVINGASELLVDVFGEKGRHARSSIGLAELPLGAPVEVEFIFEFAPEAAKARKKKSRKGKKNKR